MNEQDMSTETRETLALMRQQLTDLHARVDELERITAQRRGTDPNGVHCRAE